MTGVSPRFCLIAAVAGVLALAVLAFRPTNITRAKAFEPWKTGYWVWAGDTPAEADFTADVLYVEAPGGRWPRNVPRADAYLVVERIESSSPLTSAAAAEIAARYKATMADAGPGVPIAGLQIDYDCPTAKLESYARFLAQLHQAMPASHALSITALLDWFAPRTSIANTLAQVDEFVPQFYDTTPERVAAGIAEPVDASKWAPVFNAYQVPYRIGISSFGRVARLRPGATGESRVQFFRDRGPLDFAGQAQFAPSANTTPAGELVVRYDVVTPDAREAELRAGDVVEMTFPTDASVRAAARAAWQFGGYCAGLIAFRWPGRSETVSLAPAAVRRIVSGEQAAAGVSLDVHPAACIERACSDLYLDLGTVQSSGRLVTITADGPLDNYVAAGPLQSRALRSRAILVRVPAYAGVGKIYLGRATSSAPRHFTLEP